MAIFPHEEWPEFMKDGLRRALLDGTALEVVFAKPPMPEPRVASAFLGWSGGSGQFSADLAAGAYSTVLAHVTYDEVGNVLRIDRVEDWRRF